MKTLVLVIAMIFVLSMGCFAVTASLDVYAENSLLALPNVPLNPDPISVFATSGIDPTYIITRWDAVGQGYASYDGWEGEPGAFGNMLLGDAFWLVANGTETITYPALDDGVGLTDMWISLPGAGNGIGGSQIIGVPFAHNVAVDKGSYTGDNIFFTDGTALLTWGQACQAPYNWVSPTMTYWYGVGYDDVWFDNTAGPYELETGKGYWISTFRDNLAMIIPATN